MMLPGNPTSVPLHKPQPVAKKKDCAGYTGTGSDYRGPSPGDAFRRVGKPAPPGPRSFRAREGGSYASHDPAIPPPPQAPAPAADAPCGVSSCQSVALELDDRTALAYVSEGLPAESLARQLMEGAITGNTLRVSLLLARSDVLPDFAGKGGITPLMAAAARGHAKAAALLAAHPLVNPGRADESGWTALHFAAARRHGEIVALLLKHQAPVDIATATAKTAFDLAAGSSAEEFFWQNPGFRRHMATTGSAHPKLLQNHAAQKSRNSTFRT